MTDRVKETSTMTGLGDITLAGAMTGFQSFLSGVGSSYYGRQIRYCIQAVDSSGAPSGAWEVGEGRYTSSNTITRDFVYASSDVGNGKISFAAGTKQVWIGMDAAMASWIPERIPTSVYRTIYVNGSTGDDNAYYGDSSSTAFATIQRALDEIAGCIIEYDARVYISVAPGTYTDSIKLRSFSGDGTVYIFGSAGDLTSTIISTSGDCINNVDVSALLSDFGTGHTGQYFISSLQLTSSSGCGINLQGPGKLAYSTIAFGACAVAHINAGFNASIDNVDTCSIVGNSPTHVYATEGARVRMTAAPLTLSGGTAFSGQFAYADRCARIIANGQTYSGTATGKRYTAAMGGIIYTNGTNFPGSTAGTTATGGQYA